jgi:hypothetical protein
MKIKRVKSKPGHLMLHLNIEDYFSFPSLAYSVGLLAKKKTYVSVSNYFLSSFCSVLFLFCSLSVTWAKVTPLMIFSHPFRTMSRASRKRRLLKQSAPNALHYSKLALDVVILLHNCYFTIGRAV